MTSTKSLTEVKDVCYFAERVRHMLDVKINHLRVAMDKSDNLPSKDMLMIRIQAQIMAYQWVQARIQDMMIVIENESKEDTKIRI